MTYQIGFLALLLIVKQSTKSYSRKGSLFLSWGGGGGATVLQISLPFEYRVLHMTFDPHYHCTSCNTKTCAIAHTVFKGK